MVVCPREEEKALLTAVIDVGYVEVLFGICDICSIASLRNIKMRPPAWLDTV